MPLAFSGCNLPVILPLLTRGHSGFTCKALLLVLLQLPWTPVEGLSYRQWVGLKFC